MLQAHRFKSGLKKKSLSIYEYEIALKIVARKFLPIYERQLTYYIPLNSLQRPHTFAILS